MNNAEWEQAKYAQFNQKIDFFSKHTKYDWLRKLADEAIRWNGMCGYFQIKAEDFIKRIEQADLEYIRDWLDGKNQLKWAGITGGSSK